MQSCCHKALLEMESKYLSESEYERAFSLLHTQIDTYKQQHLSAQNTKVTEHGEQNEQIIYDIQKVQSKVREQLSSVSAGIQLDISLETKGNLQTISQLELACQNTHEYATQKHQQNLLALKAVEKSTTTIIRGFAGALVLCFVGYASMVK